MHSKAPASPKLQYKYRYRGFWCRGYYVDMAGKNAAYIQDQLKEDKYGEPLAMLRKMEPVHECAGKGLIQVADRPT